MEIVSSLVKKLILNMLLLLVTSSAIAEAPKSRVTGIFSDLYYNREAGDVVGIEMFVLFSRDGYYVLFQDAEGSPSPPVLVKAKIDGMRIEFVLPDRNGYSGKFNGEISGKMLKGKFDGGQISNSGVPIILLKRKHSYWQ